MAGIVNTLLNLLFVIGFGMGVAGVAIATGVANMVSASLIIRLLERERTLPPAFRQDENQLDGAEPHAADWSTSRTARRC